MPGIEYGAMLKGISPVISPELLAVLCRMGHGDEIVLADAHFPGESLGPACLRADGVRIPALLDGILPLFELDAYVDAPITMMQPRQGDQFDPEAEKAYQAAITRHVSPAPKIQHLERFAFYDYARKAQYVLMTGEVVKYGNIILKKGVTPMAK